MVDLRYSIYFYSPFSSLQGPLSHDHSSAGGPISPSSRSHRGKGFYSHYFLIPKGKGDHRPILDLRELNKYLKKIKFRMVALTSIIPFLGQGTWYAVLDLKDTYFHIAIHPDHCKCLRFIVNSQYFHSDYLQLLVFSQSAWHW